MRLTKRYDNGIVIAENVWLRDVLQKLADYEDIEEQVGLAPVKHGCWKSKQKRDLYICSECSFENKIEFPYCPNCGTKMDLPDKIYEANGWWYE